MSIEPVSQAAACLTNVGRSTHSAGNEVNGVYSLKWRLTDRYLRWGTLADPRPGQADADQCKSSDFLVFLQELCISDFPRF